MSRIARYRPAPYPLPHTDERDLLFQDEEAANLRDYWIVILKYRWTIAAFLLPMILIASVSLWWTTPVYVATATLHIENRSPNLVGVPEAFTPSGIASGITVDQYYQTQLNLLKSRSLAARVIRDVGFAHDPRFEATAGGLLSWVKSHVRRGLKPVATWIQARLIGVVDEPQERTPIFELGVAPNLIDRYLERLTITLVEVSQLVKVSFSSVDPSFSKDVVNAHVSTFIRTSLLTRFELTAEARQFLEEKLTELKSRLEQSEADLNRFRKAHAVVALDKGENAVLERLRGLNTDLTQARSRRIELESLYRIVQQRDHQLLSQIIDNPLIRQMKEQLSALEIEKARLATIFKPKYSGVDGLQQQINQAKGRVDQEVRRIIRSIASDYTASKAREQALIEEMERQRQAALDLREKAIEAAVLEREVESNSALYENVLKRTKETDLTGAMPISNIRVVDRADIPLQPDNVRGMRTLLLTGLVGLLGGIGLAFLRHCLDNTLKTPEDVKRFLHLPTLGMVPDVSRIDRRVYGLGYAGKASLPRRPLPSQTGEKTALVVPHHLYSFVGEAYQAICTTLPFSLPDRPPRTILITSSQPKEGKTATAINLAITLAGNDVPTLLIDADLRNGHCHRLLDMENSSGLTDVLTGNREVTKCVKATAVTNLSLLPRGTIPPNPAQLFGSDRLRQVLEALETDFSCIIIDSPPLLPVNDAVLLSTKVDGVILVVKGQGVSRYIAHQAFERLAYVKATLLGVVLNKVDIQSPEYVDYRSSYVSYYTAYNRDTQ
jgi:succinoglycan biosynthesis transport protein ExoP